jgi:CO/xanthine dehydrogenase Mo-binding subunit
VWRACLKAIEQMKQTAAQVLRCDIDLLDYDGEYVFLVSDPSIRVEVTRLVRGYMYENGMVVGEVVQACADARLPRYSGFDPVTGQGSMGVSYTFGAQAAEIRVEKKTGKIIVDHFASCFDVGRVIQPQQIRGQITGGVVMTVGAALCEEVRFDENGKCLNPYFSKYRFPTIKDAPRRQTVELVETPGVIGPYGARGIGEHPVIGPPPAILNAIHDATGIDFFEIPVTPEKMKKALEERLSGGKR